MCGVLEIEERKWNDVSCRVFMREWMSDKLCRSLDMWYVLYKYRAYDLKSVRVQCGIQTEPNHVIERNKKGVQFLVTVPKECECEVHE